MPTLWISALQAAVPAAPTLNSPGSSSSPGPTIATLTPTFSWTASAGATGYGLYIRDQTTGVLIYDNDNVANVTSLALPSGFLVNGHEYRWNMRAKNASGFSGFSGYLYFQTPGSPPPAPTLNSPGSGAGPGTTIANLTPTFSWTASASATGYGLYIRDQTTGVLIYDNDNVPNGTALALPAGFLVNGHEYRWNMRAKNAAGFGVYSAYLYFQTPGSPPPAPTLNSPGSGSGPGTTIASLTPTFSWTASAGATAYGLYIRDQTTGVLIYDNDNVPNGTALALPAGYLVNGHEYRWNMRAKNASGFGTYSGYLYFQTPAAPQPDLVAENVTFTPGNVAVGGNFTINYRIRNLGPGNAVATIARMRLSLDQNLTSGDPGLSPLDENIPALASGQHHDVSRSVTVPAGTASGNYYAGVFADAGFALSQPTGNDDGVSATTIAVIAPVADLVAENVTFTPGSVAVGGSFTINYRIRNLGPANAVATTARMRMSLDQNLTSGDLGLSPLDENIPALASGQFHDVSRQVTVPDGTALGDYYVGVFADAGFALNQPTANDDAVSATRIAVIGAGPDLIAENVTFTPSSVAVGGSFTIGYRIRNAGAGNAGATIARMRISSNSTLTKSDPGLTPLDENIPALIAGAFHNVSRLVTVPSSVSPGNYYVGVFADAGFALTQPTGNDAGISASQIAVTTLPRPDLVVDSVSFNPVVVNVGENFTIQFRVRNAGPASAPATLARLRLSLDTDLTFMDEPLLPLDLAVGALPSGAFQDVSVSVQVRSSTPPGLYYVGVFTDWDNRANQSDVQNDGRVSVSRITVNGIGLAPTILTHPQSQTVAEGEAATFSVVAGGTGPLRYQWRFNGNSIAGATAAALLISPINARNQGNYMVEVSNAGGTTASVAAALTVQATPPIAATLPSHGVCTVFGDILQSRPTVVITHGWQPLGNDCGGVDAPACWQTNMAGALRTRVGANLNIVMFRWQEAYNLLPSRPYVHTASKGEDLAKFLSETLGQDYDQPIHFIGHSFGSFVNAHAAEQIPYEVSQFTILDAPMNDLAHFALGPSISEFFDRHLKTGHVLWVDNYYGNLAPSFGEPLAGAAPNGGAVIPANHMNIQSWYTGTIVDLSSDGFGYSVLLGNPPRPNPLQWRAQNVILRRILEVTEFARFYSGGFRDDLVNGVQQTTIQLMRNRSTYGVVANFF